MLLQPQIRADGTIQEPTSLMRRAAKSLSDVNNMRIMDTQGRLKAEAEVIALTDALEAMRELQEPINWIDSFNESNTPSPD
jgi:signal recognition particle GTPase